MRKLSVFLGSLLIHAMVFGQSEEPPRPEFKTGKADPGAPVPDPVEAMKRMKTVGPDLFELGLIRFNSKTHEVRVPAVVNMREGALEFALVHETGKTHESLLKTTASALDLQVAMLLCNYQPGHSDLFNAPGDEGVRKKYANSVPKTPGANKVQIEVEWKDGEKTRRVPIQQWLLEAPAKKPPTDFENWIFNGSMIQPSGFSAELYGSLVAIYYDVTAVMNCPSKLNGTDDVWSPNTSQIPKEETPVSVIITPFEAKK